MDEIKNFGTPWRDPHFCFANARNLSDICIKYGLCISHDRDESDQNFARRLVDALAIKKIDFENAIERVEKMIAETSMGDAT